MNLFCERLKQLRTERKLTQRDIAAHLKISQIAFSYWETGKREPSIETIKQLSTYFHVTIDYLLGSDIDRQTYPTTSPLDLYGLTEEEIEDVKDYIEFIKRKRNIRR